ncbi:recombinase family protein [uncultured Pontibacter sp.]|uniref:recombinase family protein n=1 Tax=uncultured Pontibacter sp. TaxID=453356 RepID=UPI00344EF3E6
MSNLNSFKAFTKGKNSPKGQKDSNRIVVYTRVSTKEQAETNQSLSTQKKYCDAYALDHGLEVAAYFGGTYESAKTDERKEFNRMLAFVKSSKEQISKILVYSPDRFSRSGANAIYISQQLRENGIDILSVTQQTDTRTSSGKFHQNMQFLFSQWDNDQRREKSISGTIEKLRRGEWPTKAPLGYNQSKLKGEQVIVVNDTGKLLKKAFTMKAEQHLSNVEILEWLNKMGLSLTKQRLSEIFKNPFYCGVITHAMLGDEVVQGKHEKLVSEKVFLQVNNLQKKNNHGYTQSKYDARLPLRSHLKCATCGTNMTGYEVKSKGILYYKCNKVGCKVNKNAEQLHTAYHSLLNSFAIDERLVAPLKQQLVATLNSLNEQKAEDAKQLKATLRGIQNKLDAMEERFVMGEITKAQFEKFSQKLIIEKQQIEASLGGDPKKLSNLEKYVAFSLKMCSEMAKMWVLGDYHTKQKLQKLVFPEGVAYDKENDDYRTEKINSVLSLIASLSTPYGDKNKRPTNLKVDRSVLVAGTRLELATFGL